MTSRNTRWIDAAVILAALALPMDLAAETYDVTTLQGLGGGAGANSINDRGWVTGQANKQGDAVSRAALWVGGPVPIDLGSLGGPNTNSAVAWPVKSKNGVIVGISDTTQDNPPESVAELLLLLAVLRTRRADREGLQGVSLGERRHDGSAGISRRLQQLRHGREQPRADRGLGGKWRL